MLLNLCAYWNETRGTVFKNNNLLQYAIQQEGQFSKKNTNLCYLCAYLKWNKRGSFQKNPIDDNMLLNLCAKWNKRGSFQKTTIYYCMLFNLCAYWNETRGIVFKKKKYTNLLQYAIQLVCILKSNKMDRFQKNPIDDNMLLNSCAEWNKRGSFPKTHKLLLYAIQLVCVLKWNKRDSFQKKKKTPIYYSMLFNKRGSFQKTTIYYCMLFNLCAYWNETRGIVFKKKKNNLLQYAIQLVCILKSNKMDSFKKIQLMTICYWTRVRNESRGAVFQKHTNYYMLFNLYAYWNETRGAVFKKNKKTPIYYSMLFNLCAYWNCMLFNLCAYWNETRGTVFKKNNKNTNLLQYTIQQEGQFSENNNLLLYDIQLVCVLKWNKRDSFQKKKTPIYYSMLFNLCAYLKWNKRAGFQKNPIDENMLLNLCAKWNKRGSFQKTTIYYCMLFNLCAYWNETRGIVFKKKNTNLLQYAIQLVCILKSNKMDRFQKNPIDDNMLLNSCAKWNKRGSFQKTTKITVCYSTCVRIEMKQEGQFSKKKKKTPIYYSILFNKYLLLYAIQLKKNKMDRFQKNPIDDNMLLNSCAKWNKRGSFPKTHKLLLYAIQLVCVLKWNKRDSFQKKQKKQQKHQFITVCYSTCVHIEIKQDGQISKKSNWWQYATELVCEMNQEGQFSKNNKLLQYAIQLVCVLKWNKRDSFQKNPIDDNMLLNSCAEWNKRGSFPKTHKLLLYAIQLVCVLKWNKRDSFQKKIKKHQFITVYYSTRGAVFRKQQFITVCYSTRVRIEMKQEGQFSKKKDTNLLHYAIQLVCIFKSNKMDRFQKNPIDDNMLLNSCAKWIERGSFPKTHKLLLYAIQLVCVLKWNKRGSFQKKQKKKKNTNLLQYAIQLVCILKSNKMDSFQKNPIDDNMLLNSCAKWIERGSFPKTHQLLQYAIQLLCVLKWNKRDSFQKNPIDDNMLLNSCAEWNKRGSFPKTHKLLLYAIQLVCVLKWNKRDSFQKKIKKHQFITVYYSTRGAVFRKQQFITVWYSTRVRIEMKQEGQFSKKKDTNLLHYAIQLVCIFKSNKMDRFQKNPIDDNMLLNSCAKWIERGSFPKTHKLLLYAIQLVCVLKWNKRGSFQKKQKKQQKHQFITVCYSTCVHIEIKQDGQFSKKSNWWQYATELVCEMNREGQFSKNTQIITVCYSTCVRIEMKQEG